MLLKGRKLINCIINSSVFDNIIPYSIAKVLGLTLTKNYGKCYSTDEKKVPPIDKVKDTQTVLETYLDRRLKLTILVEKIPTSNGMLLSRTFCRDMGGEIKMDWSEEIIPVGNKKVRLTSEEKNK